MVNISVESAVYGALASGNENLAQAMDATMTLDGLIQSQDAIVKIDNNSMGADPSPGNGKHFGATINRNGQRYFYACAEGQTIDFQHGGIPAS